MDEDEAREVHPWTDFQNSNAARQQHGVRDFGPKYEQPDDIINDGMQPPEQAAKEYQGNGATVDAALTGETPPVEPGTAEEATDDKSTEEKQVPPA